MHAIAIGIAVHVRVRAWGGVRGGVRGRGGGGRARGAPLGGRGRGAAGLPLATDAGVRTLA